MNADLHCHSCISDGTLEPEAVAARARANGVELWALTDHDEIGGQQRARDAALALGLPYLTGTEISVTFAELTSAARTLTSAPSRSFPVRGSLSATPSPVMSQVIREFLPTTPAPTLACSSS